MKKLLLCAALLLVSSLASAQTTKVLSATTCPGTGCLQIEVGGAGTSGIQISDTFSGTLQFEQTINGSNWVAWSVTPIAGGASVTSATSTGIWVGNVVGVRYVRVRFSAFTSGAALVATVKSEARATSPSSSIAGGTSSYVPFFNSSGQLSTSTCATVTAGGCFFYDSAAEKLNIIGGVTGNNGPLLVTRKATGGSPVLASGISVYRNSQYLGGTPTVGDIVNSEFLLQADDNAWYTVGGVGGKITGIATGSSSVAGGPIFHCKPAGGALVDNTIPCMFLSSLGKLRIGDGNEASAILEIKDVGTNFVLSAPTLTQNEAIATKSTLTSLSPGNPVATTSLTDVMMGLGSTLTFTPKVHGRVRLACTFTMQNGTSGSGTFATMYRGTGVAPANGVAVTGTQAGGGRTYTAIANNQQFGTTLEAFPTLTVGVASWFDIAVRSVTSGTSTLTSVGCSIMEI